MRQSVTDGAMDRQGSASGNTRTLALKSMLSVVASMAIDAWQRVVPALALIDSCPCDLRTTNTVRFRNGRRWAGACFFLLG